MAKTTADDLVMGKFDLFMRATNHGGTFKVYIAEKGELVQIQEMKQYTLKTSQLGK